MTDNRTNEPTGERVKKIILESLVFTNENSDPWAQLLTENILAALDEAPEPETLELFPGTNAALDRLTVRKTEDANAFCIEHGNFHAVELGDPTCQFEDGFGEPVGGETDGA